MTMTQAGHKKFIDVEEIVRSKNPRLLNIIPGFILKYIKRILHQDEINSFIDRNSHLHDFDFARAILQEFGVNLTVSGIENLPGSGRCIIACNHPLGGLDGIAVLHAIGEKRKDVRFIVNDVLMQLKNLEGVFIGVNKHGSNTHQLLEDIDKLYASESATMIFPAGLVSRKQNGGVIKDLQWKKSFISKARKYNSPIVPVYIAGNNTPFFYNLSRWRTRLRIKANIEMFYLVDEMYKQYNHSINVVFGKPISPASFTKQYTDLEWAQRIKEHVYQLPSNPGLTFV